jgi:hypothetical protein
MPTTKRGAPAIDQFPAASSLTNAAVTDRYVIMDRHGCLQGSVDPESRAG